MNTYDLTINLLKSPSAENRPLHYHIESDENILKDDLTLIVTRGILIDDGYGRRYVPGHRIDNIEIVEKTDVIESIKAALTED